MARVTELLVNGGRRRIDADSDRTLLSVLRDDLDLTGTKFGCGEGQCAACTVLVDGVATKSCLTKVGAVAGKRIVTIEGLAPEGKLHPVQQAFLDADALQCGYCTPGMILGAVALLGRTPNPSEAEIVERHERAHLPVRHVSAGGARDPVGGGERRPGMKRRDFFAVLGGGIVVLLDDEIYAQETGGPRRGAAGAVPVEIGAWLHIGETGVVTVYTGKVEVGQNARTSLTQAVVEELHAPPASVTMVMGDTDLTPFDIGHGGQHDDAAHVAADPPGGGGGARDAARPGGAEVERGSRDADDRGRQGVGGRALGGLRRTGARREVDAHDSGERAAGGGHGVEGGREIAAQGQRARRSSPARTSTRTT